jgi:hypothetical protein
MMNWDAISAVSDTIATIAVIVSLIYLAVQVNQNTETLKRQGLQSARDRYLNYLERTTETQVDAEIFRKGLNNFEKMSPAEQGCFHSKMHPLIHSFHHAWDLQRAGLLPDYEFTATRNHTISRRMTALPPQAVIEVISGKRSAYDPKRT